MFVIGMIFIISHPAQAHKNKRPFVVQFTGPSEVVTSDFTDDLLDLEINPTGYECFKMPLVDPESGKVLGKGIDCLNFDPSFPGPTLVADAVSFFIFKKQGTLVTKGKITLQPFVAGFGNGGTPPRTHITGGIPSEPNIVHGTKRFRGAQGTVRLSGAVALAGTKNGNPFFDCLWVVDLQKRKRNRR
jgi:hypothetical protein